MVTALAERGITLAGVSPKPATAELLANADLVVTMSRHANGPAMPGAARHGSYAYPFAEADGNRTRLSRVAAHTGFEDRGAHQDPDASKQAF